MLVDALHGSIEPAVYRQAIVDENILGKDTASNRKYTLGFLACSYGLDGRYALFRALIRLWPTSTVQQRLLAFQLAMARDPLLRASAEPVLALQPGEAFSKDCFVRVIRGYSGIEYSANSIASFSRNLSSTWSQAGFLAGRVEKHRARPDVGPANMAFACFCAWLDGWQGESLLLSPWVRNLDLDRAGIEALIDAAARQGLLRLLKAGGVYEFRFPGYLTADEEASFVQA